MDTRPSPTPPAAARPKNSTSPSTPSQVAGSSQQPATMPSGSKPPRGTTPAASRSAIKLTEGNKPARPSSKDSLKQKMMKKPEEAPRLSKSEEQLKALKSDFDGLRTHITCKICDRLLYEPYIISCGHTYCYSCLCTWFLNNKARKTCPDCRTVVTHPPAPAYVIREMTLIFVNRAELLPAGETLEQHAKWQKEEADAVQQDKNNTDSKTGGLFKGCFRSNRPTPSLRVVRDQEDGVDRCPMCSWELEDGECGQCGLTFDDNGELTWGDSFGGFSDMDETSERDMSGEDLDPDLDMEDGYDGYDEPIDGWQDYLGDEGPFMMRRFLETGIAPGAYGRRRRLTHSEAGSRRSYSQSIVSDIYTDEMDTVEEEDEEGLDEDSSMNDFIEDGESGPATSRAASSTPAETPQPSSLQTGSQRRARRIVESEASSSIGSVPEEEDEEDEGPIRPGRRNIAQTRILNRANGVRRPIAPPSSASETSLDQDLDEDTRRLLQSEGWMLQHDGPDDDMDEDDEDDDSDGGRTTVGWDATAISNDRVRRGGSLTPTADRPRPNAPIRPPSRVGNTRFPDASRGLRRRSSVLSSSTVNYEDGEADDDDSDLDQDGDLTMAAMNSLRYRRSRAQMRQSAAFSHPSSRFANRGLSQGDAIDLDTDDNSDTAQPTSGRRMAPRTRRQEYDPRISWMFADHQRALQDYQRPGSLLDQEPRSTTPIARPRTANRNRPSPAQPVSPFMPPVPSRLRTPLMNNSSNHPTSPSGQTSPPSRAGIFQNMHTTAGLESPLRVDRAASVASNSTASSAINTPSSSITSLPSANTISQAQANAAVDMIDRPPSRVGARPPSANGRRNSTGFSPVYPGFPHPNVGLNIGGRIFQPPRLGNPWGAFVQPGGVRTRSSRAQLREQTSTATLRAVNSRANIRDVVNPSQGMRSPPSRIDLRAQPSRRRLNNQSSTRTLRASEHARPPQSPTANTGSATSPVARPARFTPDERDTLARELINNRMRALGGTYQTRPTPVRTNPWRPSTSPEAVPVNAGPVAPQHIRSNSNESMASIGSSGTASGAPPSPNLNRRRSRRDISVATASAFPISQATFSPPANTYTNSYLRTRQGSLTGGSPAYESPINTNTRGLSPMVAAGNSGLL
ncbi:uncharacterized protein BDR25DRAFT_340470 [Lindgomyces ingoldianus]|uniref:Uncharacterized protein n=1 Tax=Lindgomyces ingoldianus TaxID=673940 RepID=A0ACB6R649_9PLEO|nr:uncharacterized protein BDR25DRAFT_340470 [Lindgomyces ingoldianus]KAF2474734.1 hypothetical protein BDR25DRAFT_340470 [Lindgomyces ingoldianus]